MVTTQFISKKKNNDAQQTPLEFLRTLTSPTENESFLHSYFLNKYTSISKNNSKNSNLQSKGISCAPR